MAAVALVQHYVEYLTSPAILLTIALVVAPILFTVIVDWLKVSQKKVATGIPGCRRIGIKGRSNLHDQDGGVASQSDQKPYVKALFTYPIKSCRGIELGVSQVEPLGFSYDRLFTFAQKKSKGKAEKSGTGPSDDMESTPWHFITEREYPRLALVETQLFVPEPRLHQSNVPVPSQKTKLNGHALDLRMRERSGTHGSNMVAKSGPVITAPNKSTPMGGYFSDNGGCLVVRFPSSPPSKSFRGLSNTITLQIPLQPTPKRAKVKQYTLENVTIWEDNPKGINMTNEIDADKLEKLKCFLGVSGPLALFRRDDRHLRPVTRCLPEGASVHDFKVGFSDAFPVNIVGLSSIRDVDKNLPENASAKGNLDPRRFRANIYLTSIPPYAEDQWKRLTLGRRLGRDQQGLFETEAEYHVACRTARCTLPNVDPATGLRDRNEPYTTLSKTRKVDEGAKPFPCLGMQMIPLFQRGVIRVGDEVEVLETGEHVYEKMLS